MENFEISMKMLNELRVQNLNRGHGAAFKRGRGRAQGFDPGREDRRNKGAEDHDH